MLLPLLLLLLLLLLPLPLLPLPRLLLPLLLTPLSPLRSAVRTSPAMGSEKVKGPDGKDFSLRAGDIIEVLSGTVRTTLLLLLLLLLLLMLLMLLVLLVLLVLKSLLQAIDTEKGERTRVQVEKRSIAYKDPPPAAGVVCGFLK